MVGVNQNIPKPDAVFFDWDGTLVDTLPGLFKAHNHVRNHFDLEPWTEEIFHHHMRNSSRELYPSIYGDRVEEAFSVLRKFMSDNLEAFLKPLDNAENLLVMLQSKNMPVGIVSNKRHEILLNEINHLGWGHYIAVTVGAGYAEKDKPSGVPILKALSEIDMDPQHHAVWFVGDTETDMLAAKDAACLPVLVVHGQDRQELIDKHNPVHVSQDCASLEQILSDIII